LCRQSQGFGLLIFGPAHLATSAWSIVQSFQSAAPEPLAPFADDAAADALLTRDRFLGQTRRAREDDAGAQNGALRRRGTPDEFLETLSLLGG